MTDDLGFDSLPMRTPTPMKRPDPAQAEADIEVLRQRQAETEQRIDEARQGRASKPPWTRLPGRPFGVKLREAVLYPWLGPYNVGDKVTVNGMITGVIEHVEQSGMIVIPQAPANRDTQDAGTWVPSTGVLSITSATTLPVDRAPLPVPEEPTGIEDASLPMAPPPVQPGGEATFR